MKIGDILSRPGGLSLASYVLGKEEVWILSHTDIELKGEELERALKALRMLEAGYPLHYITGEKEFMGLKFKVEEGVFIPRYETETLVEIALDLIREQGFKVVADVGTGCGAIGISIAKYAGVEVLATDVSERAVKLAEKNAEIHKVEDLFKVRPGPFLDPFLEEFERIDLIVSNPPYVEEGAELPEDVMKEPGEALFAGKDGLDFFRGFFTRYDLSGKTILMEFSGKGKEKISDIVGEDVKFLKDLDGTERFFLKFQSSL